MFKCKSNQHNIVTIQMPFFMAEKIHDYSHPNLLDIYLPGKQAHNHWQNTNLTQKRKIYLNDCMNMNTIQHEQWDIDVVA